MNSKYWIGLRTLSDYVCVTVGLRHVQNDVLFAATPVGADVVDAVVPCRPFECVQSSAFLSVWREAIFNEYRSLMDDQHCQAITRSFTTKPASQRTAASWSVVRFNCIH